MPGQHYNSKHFFFFLLLRGYNAIWHPGIAKASDGKNKTKKKKPTSLFLLIGVTVNPDSLVYLLSYTGLSCHSQEKQRLLMGLPSGWGREGHQGTLGKIRICLFVY